MGTVSLTVHRDGVAVVPTVAVLSYLDGAGIPLDVVTPLPDGHGLASRYPVSGGGAYRLGTVYTRARVGLRRIVEHGHARALHPAPRQRSCATARSSTGTSPSRTG